MMKVDLLRHGALEGGIKYRGMVNDLLTEEGQKSMDMVWARLANSVDRIISSPLSRCLAPARIWADQSGVPLVIEPRMAEMKYGVWEGLTPDEIRRHFPGMLERWREDPEGMRIPDAETVEDLRIRVVAFWEDLRKEARGENILVVAHSGSLRMLIAHVLGAPVSATRRLKMPYACWSRIKIRDDEMQLVFYNKSPDEPIIKT